MQKRPAARGPVARYPVARYPVARNPVAREAVVAPPAEVPLVVGGVENCEPTGLSLNPRGTCASWKCPKSLGCVVVPILAQDHQCSVSGTEIRGFNIVLLDHFDNLA